MSVEILTKADLQQFKSELFEEIKNILSGHSNQQRKWLKTYEVRQMLDLSAGTLQTLRQNGSISFSKVGGLIFYSYEDVMKLMEKNKKPARK